MRKIRVTINLDDGSETQWIGASRDLKHTLERLEMEHPTWTSMVITMVRAK